MRPVPERERNPLGLTALLTGLASAAALAVLSAPAFAGEECQGVTLSYDKPSYSPNETIQLSVCGEPGTLLGLMFDRVGGPVYIPGWGTFEVAGSSSFVIVPLPPMPDEGCLTLMCDMPCGSPLLDVPIYTQVLSYDTDTEEFCLSNGEVLLIESNDEVCLADLQGCTPGFWRNHADANTWASTGLDPEMDYNDVFGVADFPGVSLMEALKPPGKFKSFAAHSVAALLNARQPDTNYGMSWGAVITCTRDAIIDSQSWEDLEPLKDTFKDYNEMGCPF